MSDVVIVLTTFPVEGDAESLARTLVDERLAACVSILPPMRSIYTWQGATEHATEQQLLIKTTTHRVRNLETRLKEMHPFDVPEFLVISILDGSRDYLSWLADSTRTSG